MYISPDRQAKERGYWSERTCLVIRWVSFNAEQDTRTMNNYVTATVACRSLHLWLDKNPIVFTA